jgi:dienelactone hydrolase
LLLFGSALAMAGPLAAQTGGNPASPSAEAKPPLLPVATFAQRDLFSQPLMSPDGARVAVFIAADGKSGIKVLDTSTTKSLAVAILPDGMEYGWHRWAGRDIVLISVSQIVSTVGTKETRASRLVALKVATGKTWFVGPTAMGLEGDDLIHVAEDGSSVLLSFQRSVFDWPSVSRVSLLDPESRAEQVQAPVRYVWEWYADDRGVVRMGTGWSEGRLQVRYRTAEGEKLRVVARVGDDEEEKLWAVSRIIGGSDEALVVDEDDDGRKVLARYNLATRQRVATVYRHDSWDVTTAWLDPTGKPFAVDYVDDRDRRVWLEPAMVSLQGKLESALKEDEVRVGSQARDKSRMLVFAGGASDPGAYYIYDAERRALDVFANLRPDLNLTVLAKPKPISYVARDGTKIAGYLTLPRGRAPNGLPLIIMPHGGPYGVRDKLRYDDEVQFLANRGYAVLQPNYRGSGGYGGDFEEKGDGQIGRAMQDDIDDAMDWAVREGIADKGRVCVVGASYGGYAAMWAVLRNAERYRCAASFAGVTDWTTLLSYDAKFLSRHRGREWKERVAGENFDLDTVSPLRAIAKLDRPLLVAHGKKDTRVPFSQYKLLLSRAQSAGVRFDELVFDEAGHGFDKPEDEARWFSALESFLAKHNPAD